jgi:hypothetical protein
MSKLTALDKVRALKRQAKALAAMIDFGPDWEMAVNRASGEAECIICGLKFREHPYDTEMAAVITCDGKLWHL